jgi:putative tryptophan/tyrosine transport system substrate-binding protein
MKKIMVSFLASLLLLGLVSDVFPEQKSAQGTKEEAKAMVEKAAEWFKKYGREKTLAEIQRGGTEKKGAFKDRDLYIFAYDFNGVCVAQGDNPKLVGQNLYNWQDADGRYNIRGHIDLASKKGSGWSPVYKWTNPETKKIEAKITYIKKIDDTLWIGSGVYGKEAQPVVEKRIGVLMFSEPTRYNESLKGIRDQLKKDGFGEAATSFTVENAGGSYVKTAELARKFAAAKMDLILAIGTSATEALLKEIKDVPIVFSVVYDPVAAGLVKSLKSSGNNATGTSPRIPLSSLVKSLKEFAPVKKLAVLYSPGEKNSQAQLKELQELQSSSQIKIVAVPLAKKEEVAQILPEVIHTTDAIYLTGSSIVSATIAIIVDSANRGKVVTITHLDDLVENGVLLGVCADSYQGGRLAGEMAVKILKGAKPSSLPIEPPKKIDVIINTRSVKAGQFQVPPDFMKKVTKTVD